MKYHLALEDSKLSPPHGTEYKKPNLLSRMAIVNILSESFK